MLTEIEGKDMKVSFLPASLALSSLSLLLYFMQQPSPLRYRHQQDTCILIIISHTKREGRAVHDFLSLSLPVITMLMMKNRGE